MTPGSSSPPHRANLMKSLIVVKVWVSTKNCIQKLGDPSPQLRAFWLLDSLWESPKRSINVQLHLQKKSVIKSQICECDRS